MALPILTFQKLINAQKRPALVSASARIDLAGPRHGEELVDRSSPSSRAAIGRIRPMSSALDDDRIIDMDADHLADHD